MSVTRPTPRARQVCASSDSPFLRKVGLLAVSALLTIPIFVGIGSSGFKIGPFYILQITFLLAYAFQIMSGSSANSVRFFTPVHFLLLLSMITDLISMMLGENESWVTFIRFILGVKLMFFVGSALSYSKNNFYRATLLILILIGLNISASIYEFFSKTLILSYFYTLFPVQDTAVLLMVSDKVRDEFFRCSSIFPHPIVLGIVAGTTIPLYYAMMQNSVSFKYKALSLIMIIIAVFAAYASGSRSAIGSIVVSGISYSLLLQIRGFFKSRSKWIFFSFIVFLIITPAAIEYYFLLKEGTTSSESVSALFRQLSQETAWPYIIASPFFGYGYGSDTFYGGVYTMNALTIDDSYLSMEIQTGFVGVGMFATILIMFLKRAYLQITTANSETEARLIGAYASAVLGIMASQSLNSITYCFSLMFLYIGLLSGPWSLSLLPWRGIRTKVQGPHPSLRRTG